MGDILVGKPQNQPFKVFREAFRELDSAHGGQPGRLFRRNSGILKGGKAGKEFKDGDTESVVVGFLMEYPLHGLGGGIEGSHAGLRNHKGILPGVRTDPEVDKNNMLSGIVRNKISRLKILVENAGIMDGAEALNDRRDYQGFQLLCRNGGSGGQHF